MTILSDGTLHILYCIAAFLTLLGSGDARAQNPVIPVAIAIEFSGMAETQVGGRAVPVALLSEFKAGDRLRMHRGAKMTVLLYRTGVPFSVEGPSLLKFSDASILALSGSEPSSMQPISGKDGKRIRIHPNKVTEAATIVRGLARPILARTAFEGIILNSRPTLKWHVAEPGLEYQIALKNTENKLIFRGDTRESELELPDLDEGHDYRWSIHARSPNGGNYGSEYRFSVATTLQKELVENFRPAHEAANAVKIVYAVWLAQSGFLDEAAAYREGLAADGLALPGDTKSKNK